VGDDQSAFVGLSARQGIINIGTRGADGCEHVIEPFGLDEDVHVDVLGAAWFAPDTQREGAADRVGHVACLELSSDPERALEGSAAFVHGDLNGRLAFARRRAQCASLAGGNGSGMARMRARAGLIASRLAAALVTPATSASRISGDMARSRASSSERSGSGIGDGLITNSG
jgi:hypothetical protein